MPRSYPRKNQGERTVEPEAQNGKAGQDVAPPYESKPTEVPLGCTESEERGIQGIPVEQHAPDRHEKRRNTKEPRQISSQRRSLSDPDQAQAIFAQELG